MKASVAIYLLCKSIDWFPYNGKEHIRIFFKTLQSNVKNTEAAVRRCS